MATEINTRVKHIQQIYHGDLPTVFNLGIMSRNTSLERVLRSGNYEPIISDDSILITNMFRKDLVILGREYQQQKVILGTKQGNDFLFESIQSENDKTTCTRSIGFAEAIFASGSDPFEIPFLDSGELEFTGESKEISFFSGQLPRGPYTNEIVSQVRQYEKNFCEEGMDIKFHSDNRAVLSELILRMIWL